MRAPPVKCHVKLSKARVRLTTPKIDGPRRTEPIQVSAFVVQRLPVMQLEQPGMLYSDVNAPPKKGKKKKKNSCSTRTELGKPATLSRCKLARPPSSVSKYNADMSIPGSLETCASEMLHRCWPARDKESPSNSQSILSEHGYRTTAIPCYITYCCS